MILLMPKEGHVVIDSDGSIGGVELQDWLAKRAGRWMPVVAPEGLLVLERHPEEAPAAGAQLRLSGAVITRFELTHIISLINGARWQGSFHVLVRGARKTLFMKEGDIVGAASTADEDRLGELLCTHGIIERSQLEEALRVGGPSRLGAMLIERGHITPHQLFSYLRKQVEEIFFSLLFLNDGTYYFLQRALSGSAWQHLRLSTEALMLEGARRVDEMRFFREKIPSMRVTLECWNPDLQMNLEPSEQQFLAQVDGQRDLAEIARDLHLSEYDATKTAYQLLQASHVVPRVEDLVGKLGRAARDSSVQTIYSLTNAFLPRLLVEARSVGRERQMRQAPRAYCTAASPYSELFDGVELSVDGTLAREVLLGNLLTVDEGTRTTFLHRALNDFLSFTIFMVLEGLEPEAEQAFRERLDALLAT